MEDIKRLGIILAAFLFLGGYVYAQEQSNALAQSTTSEQPSAQKPPTANDVVQKMKSDLNLTPEQANAVKPIIEQNMTKQKELLDNLKRQGANENTIRNQMEQLSQERNQQLSMILSQDQMDKLKGIKTKKSHKGGKRHRMAGMLDD